MNPNRIVALLTPVVATLAGVCVAWLGKHFPGVRVDQGSLEQLFLAGAVIVLLPATQWLHGWQKYEARQADLERDVALASAAAPASAPDEEDFDAFDEPEDEGDAFDEEGAFDEDDALDELDELGDLSEADELDALDDLDGGDPLDEDDSILAES